MPHFTPWKKSRTLGDVYGGRVRLKLDDNIFTRYHSLQRPSLNHDLPILIEDNPSRDFFFPLSGEEILKAMKALPKKDFVGITHIWLRRLKKVDYIDGLQPLAWFTCGSGVRLITLFPWPNDMVLRYGTTRPSQKKTKEIERYGARIEKIGNEWVSQWDLESVRKFYIQGLLCHQIGRHVDWYNRLWSAANRSETEEYADQYAISKTASAMRVYRQISNDK